VGGILIALPLVAGPILLIITLEQGTAFGAHAARGALLGMAALGAFCVVFARAQRLGWISALACGWLAYGVIAAAHRGGTLLRWAVSRLPSLPSPSRACCLAQTMTLVTRMGHRRRGTSTRAVLPRRSSYLRSPPQRTSSARR
jgi:hypothetical protein